MKKGSLSTVQMFTVVTLRVMIGWHFLYEGLSKLTSDGWSAKGFLMQSRGPFAEMFRWMAADPERLDLVNPVHDVAPDVLRRIELRLLGQVADREARGEARLAGEAVVEPGHDPEQA